MKNVYVFCEGEPDSLDINVLKQIVPINVTIVPSGGKRSLKASKDGYFNSKNQRDYPHYIIFRDRDFDAEPSDNTQLLTPFKDKKIFLTYRACIENYLLEPPLIHQYRNRNADKIGISADMNDIEDWIKISAEKIKDYQAVRWALASLKPGERWSELSSTWTEGSGDLPESLDLDKCKTKATQLISDFIGTSQKINQDNFEKSLEKYLNKFDENNFWDQKLYFIWFHGKDLRKMMQKIRPDSISLNKFCEWAAENIIIDNYSDFIELKQKLRQI